MSEILQLEALSTDSQTQSQSHSQSHTHSTDFHHHPLEYSAVQLYTEARETELAINEPVPRVVHRYQ